MGTVLGIMVLVGNSWALFLSGGELSPVGSCPKTVCAKSGSWLESGCAKSRTWRAYKWYIKWVQVFMRHILIVKSFSPSEEDSYLLWQQLASPSEMHSHTIGKKKKVCCHIYLSYYLHMYNIDLRNYMYT